MRTLNFEWPAKYGGIFRTWLFFRPMVFISSPELMEPILSNPRFTDHPQEYSYAKAWLGVCTGTLSGSKIRWNTVSINIRKQYKCGITIGDAWRTRRRLVNTAYHYKMLNNFLPTFIEQSLVCARELEKAIAIDTKVDIYDLMSRLTLEIICGRINLSSDLVI